MNWVADKIEHWPLARLLPYARNARTHSPLQIQQLAASIEAFGLVGAIVVRDGMIAKGHGTLAACALLYGQGKRIYPPPGPKAPEAERPEPFPAGKVPVIDATGWTDEQFRAYVIADNKLALNAGWDEALLAVELTALKGAALRHMRRRIGVVFQDFRLVPGWTVYDNVAIALEVIGKKPDTINRVVPEVLEMVGLSGKANRLPGELSGGEQQRVAIARAFVNRPLVLLADEPTGNLDPDTSKDIMDLLERINRTGTTVVMATHDHHIVDSMRQRVVELSLGRLVRDEQRGVYGMDR